MIKTCTKCNITKPLAEFYKHPTGKNGFNAQCKMCVRQAIGVYQNTPQFKDYQKMYRSSEKCRESKKAYQTSARGKQTYLENTLRYNAQNPEKKAVHVATSRAIRSGVLIRQPCEVCQNPKTDGHHPDYSKPLEVLWLCRKHHLDLHREQRDQNQ